MLTATVDRTKEWTVDLYKETLIQLASPENGEYSSKQQLSLDQILNWNGNTISIKELIG